MYIILRFSAISAIINPVFCLLPLETKVNINITVQNIANSYQHFQQVFQQPQMHEITGQMSKTGGYFRFLKTIQVTKRILRKVNITVISTGTPCGGSVLTHVQHAGVGDGNIVLIGDNDMIL